MTFRRSLPIQQMADPFHERTGEGMPKFFFHIRMGDGVMRNATASNDGEIMSDFLDLSVFGQHAFFPKGCFGNLECRRR